ncbi:MAG: cyclase family protein [Proteobacteria bacterium]|nr:cyclase family protein [Pseudomonadota bacterium]
MNISSSDQTLWLSHPWGPSCPAYGNGSKIEIIVAQSMDSGASSNSLRFSSGNHIGTHMDAPKHFVKAGRSIDTYSPRELIFLSPIVLDVNLDITKRHVGVAELKGAIKHDQKEFENCDILLLRTGAESYRNLEKYWQDGPGIDVGVADFLRENAPKCRAIGIDSISITAFSDREKGRKVHRELLDHKNPIILFEDMALAKAIHLKSLVVAPLRIESADGAPVTIIGILK